MRFYISTGWVHRQRAIDFAAKLRAMGHSITEEWWRLGDRTSELGAHGIARRELTGIQAADFVVVLLPGGFGTHFEFGAAVMSVQDVILVGAPDPFDEGSCVFYGLETVSRVPDETAALAMISEICTDQCAGCGREDCDA